MRRFITGSVALLVLAACGGQPAEPKAVREPTPDEVAKAEAFLAENNTPLPEAWRFEQVNFTDGGELRIGLAPKPAPRGTIIFVPGYTSSPELASDFLARWDEMGFEVGSLDLPGQGGSVRRDDDRQKTYTGDFELYGRAVTQAAAYVETVRQSEGPLIIAGDSFGGHSILRAAADSGIPEADGLFVMVPAVQPVLGAPRWIVKWAVGGAVKAGRGSDYMDGQGPWSADDFANYDYTRCGDRPDRNFKNAALYITKPLLRVGGVSNEWGLGMVLSGENMMGNKALAAFDRPVGMVIAGQDVIVENKAADKLCTKKMDSCEVTFIEEATHCLYIEDQPTQDKVHAALNKFMMRLDAE
ncbi:MAG: alpha/beta hydrolase [Parvularculaceae bacterium]|nr:alpha/beta hydrolase [Parvularculaceae bacterium]